MELNNEQTELSSRNSILAFVFCVERPFACLCAVSPWHCLMVYMKHSIRAPGMSLPPGSVSDSLEAVWPRAVPSFGEAWVRLPDGVMGMVHPGLTLLPMGDAFKLRNYQLTCAVPWHIMGKVSRLASGDLFLSKGVGFFCWFLRILALFILLSKKRTSYIFHKLQGKNCTQPIFI